MSEIAAARQKGANLRINGSQMTTCIKVEREEEMNEFKRERIQDTIPKIWRRLMCREKASIKVKPEWKQGREQESTDKRLFEPHIREYPVKQSSSTCPQI